MKEYPNLYKILARLDGKTSTNTMRKMNYEVEVLGKKSKEVTKDFKKSLN